MLEHALAQLEVEWPDTPDLAARVAARIEGAARPRRTWSRAATGRWAAATRGGSRRRCIAVVAAVVVAGLAASPARSALLDLLGLRGVRVERREPPAHPPEKPGRLGSGLHLGYAVTLAAAKAKAGFPLTRPPSLGTPDAVWLAAQPTRVSFVYANRPGIPRSPHTNASLLLTQFRARATPVIEKALGYGAHTTRLQIPHARVYLITGKPHGFAWMAPDGSVGFEDRRLAGTTLLVERDDGILLRVEGELSKVRAMSLARELTR
jgi:hypothetical protein